MHVICTSCHPLWLSLLPLLAASPYSRLYYPSSCRCPQVLHWPCMCPWKLTCRLRELTSTLAQARCAPECCSGCSLGVHVTVKLFYIWETGEDCEECGCREDKDQSLPLQPHHHRPQNLFCNVHAASSSQQSRVIQGRFCWVQPMVWHSTGPP